MKTASVFRAALALAVIALGGCVETRFESPIGDNIETCDVRWKGLWIGVDEERPDHRDETTAFYVNEDCQFLVLDQPEKGGPLKQVHVPLNYVHDGRNDYVVVADTAMKALVSLKAPYGVDPAPEKSFFFARYRLRGDALELFQVDSERTAELVIDGKIGGTVSKTQNELHVYVSGTRAQMLDMIRAHPIFDEKPVKLRRSKQTLDAFENSLQPGAGPNAR